MPLSSRPVLLACLLMCAVPACVPSAPPRVSLDAATAVPDRCGVVFWVEGLDAVAFDALQRRGLLPNITRYLIDRGVRVQSGITSLPTITYANNVSLSTGLLPGRHGIVGNKWFDRHSLIYQDYAFIKSYQQVDHDFTAPTIYEQLHRDMTATILTPIRRGVTRNVDNCISAAVAWHFGLQDLVNDLTTARFELIADVANRAGRWPILVVAYYVAPDTIGHAAGVSGPEFERALVNIDTQVGHVCASLEKARLLDRTYVTLVSDHGFVDTPRHVSIGDVLRRHGIECRDASFGRGLEFEKRLEHFDPARAVVIVNGDRQCTLHLRAGDHWWQRPTEQEIARFLRTHGRPGNTPVRDAARGVLVAAATILPVNAEDQPDLPTMLARLEGVELVTVHAGPGKVKVFSRDGIGLIERHKAPAEGTIGPDEGGLAGGHWLYSYSVLEGADPLGYRGTPAEALVGGQKNPADAWLAATAQTGKPDVVVQLAEYHDSARAGDVNLFAAEGWDFGRDNHGGHGGLLRREIVVPWIIAGPDLPRGQTLPHARTVNLMPTMLELLGRRDSIPAGLDGVSIADALRRAGQRQPATTTRPQGAPAP